MELFVIPRICYHLHDELRTSSHQIINSANYFMSLPLPWFIFTACGDHCLFFWTYDSLLSVFICLSPCLLLTCSINFTKVRDEPISKRLVNPEKERMDLGGESLRRFTRLNRLWGVTGDLVIFTGVSDASSPSSSLMKDADAFREEVQLELDSILGTQGGICSQNVQIWRRSLCTEAVLPVNVLVTRSVPIYFPVKTPVLWGGGWS